MNLQTSARGRAVHSGPNRLSGVADYVGVSFANGPDQHGIAIPAEEMPRVGAVKMEGAVIEKFVPEFFQFDRSNVVSVLPEDRNHFAEDSQSSLSIPGSLFCGPDQSSDHRSKLSSAWQSIDHELIEQLT